MDQIARASLLFDFYGRLLTEKQRQVMELYHEENLSLSEIGEEFGISRQAVHDTLKKAEQLLTEYEEKLGLMEKFIESSSALREIELEIEEMMAETGDAAVQRRLRKVQTIIERIERLEDV